MSKSEREAELEDRVDELEDTVQRMLPSRRDMLAGSAVAGAGLLGFGAGTASADGHNDGDTQWGADANRDDYVVDHVDALSVSTDELSSNRVGNNVIYANEFSGTTLAQKVDNALTAKDEGQIIKVAPKADGTAWDWDTSITIDPTAHPGGVVLDFGRAEIAPTCSGGEAILLDSGGSINPQLQGQTGEIYGGLWDWTNADPGTAFRLEDINYGRIVNTRHYNLKNGSGSASLSAIQNRDKWSAHNLIMNNQVYGCNRGLNFRPASETGGGGTEAMDFQYITNNLFRGVADFGMRLSGAFFGSVFENNHLVLDSNAIAYRHIESDARGMVMRAGNVEDGSSTGTVGHQINSGFDGANPPYVQGYVVNPSQVGSVLTDPDATGYTIYAHRPDSAGIQTVDLSTL